LDNEKLFQLSDLLRVLKEHKDIVEADLKDLNGDIESVQGRMVEVMLTEEVLSFNRSGATFSIVQTDHPGPAPDRKTELWAAFREQDALLLAQGEPPRYEPMFTINSQTLSGLLNEAKSNNNGALPEWLDALVALNAKTTVRVTKSKKYKS
jgi:hypothetical protein